MLNRFIFNNNKNDISVHFKMFQNPPSWNAGGGDRSDVWLAGEGHLKIMQKLYFFKQLFHFPNLFSNQFCTSHLLPMHTKNEKAKSAILLKGPLPRRRHLFPFEPIRDSPDLCDINFRGCVILNSDQSENVQPVWY